MDKQYPNLDLKKSISSVSIRPSYIVSHTGTFFIKVYNVVEDIINQGPSYVDLPIMELEVTCKTHLRPKFRLEFELVTVHSNESKFVKKVMSLSDLDFIILMTDWLTEKGLNNIIEKVFEYYISNLKLNSTITNTSNYEYSNSTY